MGLTERHLFEFDDVPENYEWGLEDAVDMTDKEKVIKELQGLSGSKETMKLISDAIAMLKEQEAVEPFYKGEDYMDYFTKRTLGRCGHCKAPLPALDGMRSKFCWMCGRRVKWE